MSEHQQGGSLDAFVEANGITVDNIEQPERVEIPKDCWLDVTQELIEPTWLLKYQGIGFSPLGDIQVLRGMEGHGKSMLFTILMSAILRGEYGGLVCEIPDTRVLYIDTEQNAQNVLLIQRRVHHILGWRGKEANARFRCLMLREVEDLASRNAYLWQAIDDFKPSVVFIDGIADLVSDINKFDECMLLVRKLMAEASRRKISIWSILHVNYGSQKMRGHLGTEIAHKVSDVLSCQKDKTQNPPVFTVEQVKARNRDIQNFSFYVADDDTRLGIPTVLGFVDLDADTPTNRGERDLLMQEIFMGETYLSKRAIVDAIQRKRFISGADQDKSHAKLWLEQAIEWKILVFNSDKRQYKYVGLNADPFENTNEELDLFPE